MAKSKKKSKSKPKAKPAKKPAKKAAKPAKKPAKKPAAKKPAKKPAAKKPAAKKPAVKKPSKSAGSAGGAIEGVGTPDGGDIGHVPHVGPHGGGLLPAPTALANLAMAGDVDAIFAIVDGNAESDKDGLAYKWLAVASDFGHTAADDMMGDLLEASSLRYDDDQLVTGAAHWELGLAYLTGGEGLPRDLQRGRTQLEAALERGFPASIQDSDKEIADARASFQPDALVVFDAVYAASASGAHDERGEEADEADDDGD